MNPSRSLLGGVLLVLLSTAVVLGAFLVSMSQTGTSLASLRPTQTPTPNQDQSQTSPGFPTISTATPGSQPTPIVITTPTLDLGSMCVYPPSWQPVVLPPGASASDLAAQHGISLQALLAANCLVVETIPEASLVYVPPLPTQPPTPAPTETQPPPPTEPPASPIPFTPEATQAVCRPPASWVPYVIQPGDNLFRIGLAYGVSALTLQIENCLSSPDRIVAGQVIYVPNVPTRTPTRTSSPLPTRTIPPTATPSPTLTASSTTVPSPTATPPPPPSFTPTATPTATPTPSPTPTETPAPTFTPSDTPTQTPAVIPESPTPTP